MRDIRMPAMSGRGPSLAPGQRAWAPAAKWACYSVTVPYDFPYPRDRGVLQARLGLQSNGAFPSLKLRLTENLACSEGVESL